MAVITKNQDKRSKPYDITKTSDKISGLITTYNGGKNGNGTYQQIINLIPPHRTYIEPFVGSGAIFRKKFPALITILNDKDPSIYKYWKQQKPLYTKLFNLDALELLSSHTNLGDNAFIYIDAPYLFDVRSCKKPMYKHEAGDQAFHTELLKRAAASRCKVMISHYECDLYNNMLPGWHKHSFQSMTRNGMRTEVLWMNYDKPVVLHDDRYLGDNFRKREKIKLKRERWMNKFRSLSPEVRVSILSHLNREYPVT